MTKSFKPKCFELGVEKECTQDVESVIDLFKTGTSRKELKCCKSNSVKYYGYGFL